MSVVPIPGLGETLTTRALPINVVVAKPAKVLTNNEHSIHRIINGHI